MHDDYKLLDDRQKLPTIIFTKLGLLNFIMQWWKKCSHFNISLPSKRGESRARLGDNGPMRTLNGSWMANQGRDDCLFRPYPVHSWMTGHFL